MKDAMEIMDANAAVDKQFGQLETFTSLGLQASHTQVRSGSKANKDVRSAHFASLMDLCHLKHSELAKQLQKYIGERRASVGQRQRRQWVQSSIQEATSFSFANGISKIPGYGFAQSCSRKLQMDTFASQGLL